MGTEGTDLHRGPEAASPVTGYRKLSTDEIALMNEVKAVAVQVGELHDKLAARPEIDRRWLAIGRTDLQKGFMSVVRAIAQPGTF